ncbi:maestro heat-like repeat family member 5 isoform X1 [Aphelocoma coerulescens]|uniref:maestro heat-like repeat family member 5 isoform X1 n=1 Tax=Aphelocoma coerulescens TaxID=39617 RepID=UPI00360476F5
MAFVSSLDKDAHKFTFLKSVYVMCKSALKRGLTQGLDLFCQTCEVVENIKDILEKEPRDHLSSRVRYLSMIAIDELSLVENVLEGKTKSLLSACFSSVFCLPPEREMPRSGASLYIKTLKAMDTMLRTLVLSFPVSRVSQELQDIFEMLLDFTRSEREVVQERAVGRIGVLTYLMSNYCRLKASVNFGRDSSGPVCPKDISIPVLGKLLGRLLLFRYSSEQTSYTAFHALFSLAEFLYKSRPMDRSGQLVWKAVTTSSLCSLSTKDCTQAFGRYLHSSERTDVILEAIGALRDASILDKEVPSSMLDVAMRDPDSWLMDVPRIVSCILETLPYITTESGCKKVESLFLLMTNEYGSAVVISLCEMALQGDSTVQELCDTLSSMPEILDKVLTELATLLHNQWCNPRGEGPGVSHRASFSGQIDVEELGDEPNVWSDQEHPDVVMAFLLLEVLTGLSERAEMARKVDAFLPSMMKILEVGSEDEKLKITVVLRNILGQLKKAKASSIALMLVGKVLPLFDSVRLMWEPEPCSPALKAVLRAGSALLEWILGFAAKRCSCLLWNLTLEHRPHRSHGQGAAVPKLTFPPSRQECSQLRELSLWLFRDLLKSVLSRDEKKMRREMQSALVPLLFRLNDHLPSVAKASREALFAAAELLKWKQLKHLLQRERMWELGECLLLRRSSRAEEYIHQSLPYLRDPQSSVRLAAVRFIRSATTHMRNRDSETQADILSALQPLETDRDISISSMAAHTGLILRAPRVRRRSWELLQMLCCWCQ